MNIAEVVYVAMLLLLANRNNFNMLKYKFRLNNKIQEDQNR